MKSSLLYLFLFSLVWDESELQHHYRKSKQKCAGEHQIMVKGHHAKHGFYIFNYVYSSSVPSNQTQIKKEENNSKNMSNATPESDKENVPRKPVDNQTAQAKSDGHKHFIQTGTSKDKRPTESRQNLSGHHGLTQNRDLYQYHLEFIVGKEGNKTTTGDPTIEIAGSGDGGILGQFDSHHGVTIGNEQGNDLGKDRKDTRGTAYNSMEKSKDGKFGISSNIKPSKDSHINSGVKEKDASIFQEINPYSYIPKKSRDVAVVLKGKTDATSKDPGRKEGGYTDLSDKGKEDSATSKLHTHLNVRGRISGHLVRKIEDIRNESNNTNVTDMNELKNVNENVVKNSEVQKKGEYEYTAISRKLNRQEDRSGVTKPPKQGKVRDDIISGSHIEADGIIKLRKKGEVTEDVINGRSTSHTETAGVPKMHKKESGITEEFISPVEDPVYTKPGTTNQRVIILSGKLNSHVDGFGVTMSHPKGEVTIPRGISDSQVSIPGSIQEGRKGTSEIGIIHRKSYTGKEGFDGFIKAHPKEVGVHEKINRNAHESKLGESKTRKMGKNGVTFQDGNKDTIKGNINYSQATGITAELKSSSVDSSKRKAENGGQKSSGIKSALSLHHGVHHGLKYGLNIPKNDDLKSQERSSSTLKSDGRTMKPSKKSSKAHAGRDSTAKRYHGYSDGWRRKSSRHDKKRKLVKTIHGSDSSSSSESEENSRNDSRQSHEDYQNDTPDSYQSTESAEQDPSAESNQTDGHN